MYEQYFNLYFNLVLLLSRLGCDVIFSLRFPRIHGKLALIMIGRALDNFVKQPCISVVMDTVHP